MNCLQRRQRKHGLLLLVLCLHWDKQPGSDWELGVWLLVLRMPLLLVPLPLSLGAPKESPQPLA